MNIRQSKKIQNQVSPSETNKKNRAYWNRYNRAWIYNQRLDRRAIRKMRKEGRFVWSDTELDKLVDDILNEEKGK